MSIPLCPPPSTIKTKVVLFRESLFFFFSASQHSCGSLKPTNSSNWDSQQGFYSVMVKSLKQRNNFSSCIKMFLPQQTMKLFHCKYRKDWLFRFSYLTLYGKYFNNSSLIYFFPIIKIWIFNHIITSHLRREIMCIISSPILRVWNIFCDLRDDISFMHLTWSIYHVLLVHLGCS